MKGKIDVNCVISKEFSGELAIKSQAIIRNLNTTSTFGKNYGNLRVKPKHELKFDTVQYLASIHNQLNELDNKGGIIFKDLECDFIYAKQKNRDEFYHALIINLGTKDKPMMRTFYLTTMQVETLSAMKLEFKFTKTDFEIDDEESDTEE